MKRKQPNVITPDPVGDIGRAIGLGLREHFGVIRRQEEIEASKKRDEAVREFLAKYPYLRKQD